MKISGRRIEPGEIEAALTQHPDIKQSVVVADACHRGEKRLVAYIVTSGSPNLDADELKDYLSRRLPSYMIPSVFVRIESMRLSPNGKVDRSALAPAPPLEFGDTASVSSHAPVTELEEAISGIWQMVLNRGVGTKDNFFDLGGDSLQLIEVHSELQKTLGREVSIMDLFEFTTVRSLADRLGQEPGAEPGLTRAQERANKQRQAVARQKPTKVLI